MAEILWKWHKRYSTREEAYDLESHRLYSTLYCRSLERERERETNGSIRGGSSKSLGEIVVVTRGLDQNIVCSLMKVLQPVMRDRECSILVKNVSFLF